MNLTVSFSFFVSRLYLLTEAVPGTSVNLALNTDPSYPSDGTDVTVLGIGMQNENGGIVNGQFLYDVVIPIVNFQQCSNAWGGFLNMDLMVCAGKLFPVVTRPDLNLCTAFY